jgi:hypothetical protein
VCVLNAFQGATTRVPSQVDRLVNPLESRLGSIIIFGPLLIALTEDGARMFTWDIASKSMFKFSCNCPLPSQVFMCSGPVCRSIRQRLYCNIYSASRYLYQQSSRRQRSGELTALEHSHEVGFPPLQN